MLAQERKQSVQRDDSSGRTDHPATERLPGLGAKIGLNHVTTQKYGAVLESLFLVHTLPPWYTNALKRLTKTPKPHFLDAGLLAALKALSPDRAHRDRTPFGPVLETFVLDEILKLSSWSGDRHEFSHFRNKERNEVDIVIEDRRGRVVGVEVKASATVSRKDFSNLHRLAAACGDKFAMGVVLYDHDCIVPFRRSNGRCADLDVMVVRSCSLRTTHLQPVLRAVLLAKHRPNFPRR